MGTYQIKVEDMISGSISKKLSDISEASTRATINTGKLGTQLNRSAAHNKFITNQQKIAHGLTFTATSAHRTIATLARLEMAHIRAASSAERASNKHTLASRSILIGSARIISAISRWMALLGIGFSLKFVTQFADSFTELENKLKNVTVSSANLAKVTDEVFAAANRARAPVEAMAQTYQRIDLAVRDLGLSQKEAMGITETAAKALSLSGATAGETEAALLQLSQAFNKGKLDGDEFRTVMELMPSAADAIAKQMGVTRGELLKLAPEGKITAEVMAKAFQEAAVMIDDKFSKITPTIGQAMAVLRNNAKRAFGEFNEAHGITRRLSEAIIDLSTNLDKVGEVAFSVGAALVAVFAVNLVSAVGLGNSAVKALWLTISAHPVGAIATAIGLAVAGLVYFSDEIKVSSDGMISLRDYAVAAWELISENAIYAVNAIMEGMRQLGAYLKEVWDNYGKDSRTANEQAETSFGKAKQFIIDGIVGIVNTWVFLELTVRDMWDKFPKLVDGVMLTVRNTTVDYIEDMINAFLSIFDVVDRLGKKMSELGAFSGIEALSNIGANMSLDRPKVDLSQYKSGQGPLGTNLFEAQRAWSDFLAKTKDNFGTDFVDAALKGFKKGASDMVSPLIDAFDDRVDKNFKDKIFRDMAGNKPAQLKDPYYTMQRERKYVPDTGDKDKKTKGKSVVDLIAEIRKNANVSSNVSFSGASRELLEATSKTADKAIKDGLRMTLSSVTDGRHSAGSNHYSGAAIDFGYYKPGGGTFDNATEKALAQKHMQGSGFKGAIDELNTNSPHIHAALNDKDRGASGYFDVQQGYKKTEMSIAKKQEAEKVKLAKARIKAIDKMEKDLLKSSMDLVPDIFDPMIDAMEDRHDAYVKTQADMAEYHQSMQQELELSKMASDVVETHANWLQYKNKYAGEANSLSEESFKIIDEEITRNKKLIEIKEQMLSTSKKVQQQNFEEALAAGKGLTGQDQIDYASKMLEQYGGIDVSLLNNELNTALGSWKTFYNNLKKMKEDGDITDEQFHQAEKRRAREKRDIVLGSVEALFADLASVTKTGHKELLMISKAAAIASTIFKTYEGAQLAFTKGIEMGGLPLGVLFAATAVAQGLARVAQIRAQGSEGFERGGYTGNGGRRDVAGVVHGQEFVMNAAATSRIGVGNLQKLQDGRGLQDYNPTNNGNSASASPVVVNNPPPNITIVDSREAAIEGMKSKEGTNIVLEVIRVNGKAVARMLS